MPAQSTPDGHFLTGVAEKNAGPMTSTDASPSAEVQVARRVLAELAETGHELLTRECHLDVLLALDNLEQARRQPWPPPPAAAGIDDVAQALKEARAALVAVLGDLAFHDVEPLQAALALEHVSQALAPQP